MRFGSTVSTCAEGRWGWSTVSRGVRSCGARRALGAASVLGTWGWETLEGAAWSQEVPHPISMAMHVHSSFSEGTGSMDAQLERGPMTGVDVVWWTDHDWRWWVTAIDRSCTSRRFTETENGNDPLTWTQAKSGSLSSSSATIDTAGSPPTTRRRPRACGSAATGSGSASPHALHRRLSKARENLKGTIGGQIITFDVFPESIGTSRVPGGPGQAQQPAGVGRARGRRVHADLPDRGDRRARRAPGGGTHRVRRAHRAGRASGARSR